LIEENKNEARKAPRNTHNKRRNTIKQQRYK
jgi:hypothetical protein